MSPLAVDRPAFAVTPDAASRANHNKLKRCTCRSMPRLARLPYCMCLCDAILYSQVCCFPSRFATFALQLRANIMGGCKKDSA